MYLMREGCCLNRIKPQLWLCAKTTSEEVEMLISRFAGPSLKLDRVVMTYRPDSLSKLVKEPWDRQHAHTDETQQARRPSNAQS